MGVSLDGDLLIRHLSRNFRERRRGFSSKFSAQCLVRGPPVKEAPHEDPPEAPATSLRGGPRCFGAPLRSAGSDRRTLSNKREHAKHTRINKYLRTRLPCALLGGSLVSRGLSRTAGAAEVRQLRHQSLARRRGAAQGERTKGHL